MQGLPETTVTPVCRQGGVGAGVGKTWWRKDRKMIWEQQIISLSLKVFNIPDPDNYKGLISGLAQSAGSVAFSRCSYCAKTCSESKFKMEWGGGWKKERLHCKKKELAVGGNYMGKPVISWYGQMVKKKILACETKVEKGVCLRRLAKFSLYSKRFQSGYCAKFVAKANLKWSGEGKGRRGNACPQTP